MLPDSGRAEKRRSLLAIKTLIDRLLDVAVDHNRTWKNTVDLHTVFQASIRERLRQCSDRRVDCMATVSGMFLFLGYHLAVDADGETSGGCRRRSSNEVTNGRGNFRAMRLKREVTRIQEATCPHSEYRACRLRPLGGKKNGSLRPQTASSGG